MLSDTPSDAVRFVDLLRGDAAWRQALPVLQQLRAQLTPDLLDQVLREGESQGLRFLAAFDGDTCLGVAGWRIHANTNSIRQLYIDDLVTDAQHRSHGVGAALLDELRRRGRAAGAHTFELDSGVQRFAAHRFYLRERMVLSAHHFVEDLRIDRV